MTFAHLLAFHRPAKASGGQRRSKGRGDKKDRVASSGLAVGRPAPHRAGRVELGALAPKGGPSLVNSNWVSESAFNCVARPAALGLMSAERGEQFAFT